MTDYRFGLLGYPLGHSFSPRLHRAAMESLNLNSCYDIFPIPPTPQGSMEMQVLLRRMRHGELQGLNVTIPYKMTVIPYLDELSSLASNVGAVNAILVRGNKLVGENFDNPAFMEDLAQCINHIELKASIGQPGRSALVLGAGGSARAVTLGLLKSGWHTRVAARRPEQAREMAVAFHDSPNLTTCRLDELAQYDLEGIGLIVNTTPAGMYPHFSASAWPERLSLPPGALIYDLVYNPPQTALMSMALRSGLLAVNGLGMLARQAALSVKAWTGQLPDWQVLYRAVALPGDFHMTRFTHFLNTERKA